MRLVSLVLLVVGVLCAAIARQGPRTVNDQVMADGDRVDVCDGFALYLNHFEVRRFRAGNRSSS